MNMLEKSSDLDDVIAHSENLQTGAIPAVRNPLNYLKSQIILRRLKRRVKYFLYPELGIQLHM